MTPLIYIDGQYLEKEKAAVSVFDHGLLYGDGVFEGIRAYDGCVFRLRQHLDRLYDSAKYIMLEIPVDRAEMAEIVKESCRKNGLRDAYIRLVVTRGAGDLGLAPWKCPRASVICIADRIKMFPPEFYENGLNVVTASTRRAGPEVLNPRVKSLNYLNNILAKIEAKNANAEEAIILNDQGYVVEGTGENVFFAKGGALCTPPMWIGALRGITRDTVIELARAIGIAVREEPFTRYQLIAADEVFFTGTAAEIIPVTKMDARPIANGKPGPITQKLTQAFRSVVGKDGDLL